MQEVKQQLEEFLSSKVIVQDNVLKSSVSKLTAKEICKLSDLVLDNNAVSELEVKRSGTKVTILVYLKEYILIDPPSGWRYGFPKRITKEEYHSIKDLKEWCISNGYPKSEADSYGDYFNIGITGNI